MNKPGFPLWLSIVLCASCTNDQPQRPAEAAGDSSPAIEDALDERKAAREQSVRVPGTRVPMESDGDSLPITGEAPADLLARVIADAAVRTGFDATDILVLRDQSIVFNDGSLGCPEPDVMYTQALVPGYWIVLKAGEETLDYRAAERGEFRLCEGQFKADPRDMGAPVR